MRWEAGGYCIAKKAVNWKQYFIRRDDYFLLYRADRLLVSPAGPSLLPVIVSKQSNSRLHDFIINDSGRKVFLC